MEIPQSQPDLIEGAINKLAGIIPQPISEEQLKEVIADRVPKAFYYQMLLDLLLNTDNRSSEVILTEARLLVKLLQFRIDTKRNLTPPKTTI